MVPYGLGVVFDPQRARNGITLISHVFALRSIASESTASGEPPRHREALGDRRRAERVGYGVRVSSPACCWMLRSSATGGPEPDAKGGGNRHPPVLDQPSRVLWAETSTRRPARAGTTADPGRPEPRSPPFEAGDDRAAHRAVATARSLPAVGPAAVVASVAHPVEAPWMGALTLKIAAQSSRR